MGNHKFQDKFFANHFRATNFKYPAMHQFPPQSLSGLSWFTVIKCLVCSRTNGKDHHHVRQCPLVPIDATVIARQQQGNTETHWSSATEF